MGDIVLFVVFVMGKESETIFERGLIGGVIKERVPLSR
jgi:hypothetical protein